MSHHDHADRQSRPEGSFLTSRAGIALLVLLAIADSCCSRSIVPTSWGQAFSFCCSPVRSCTYSCMADTGDIKGIRGTTTHRSRSAGREGAAHE